MSSNASINLSNVSPAESSIPLPIPRLATPAPPAMLPRTTQNTLAANPDIDNDLLQTIANGLLTTIANQETDTAIQYQRFNDQIRGLQERILQYEETFEHPPEGYVANDNQVPHFRIPCSHGLSRPAKWIKLNNDGTISGYTDTNSPSSSPHIIDLYAQPDDQYDEEGNPKPAATIPLWFHFLMVGPTINFTLLHSALLTHGDWGLTREVHQYCKLDTEYADVCMELEQLQVWLDAIQQACSSCKSRLQLVRASEQVEKLSHIPHKPQANRSGWKRKSNGQGHPF